MQICPRERPFLRISGPECVLRVRAFGGAVEPSMTQEGNPPIFKRLVDEKKREWTLVESLGGGGVQRG